MTGGRGKALFAWRPEPAPAGTALLATIVALGLGAAVLAAFVLRHRPVPFALDFRETPFYGPNEVSTHLSTIKYFFDARGQSLGHLAMTLAVALLTFMGMRLRVRPDLGGSFAPGFVALATLAAWYSLPGPRGIAYAGAILLLSGLLVLGRFLKTRPVNVLSAGVLVASLGIATLPGFLHPPDYTRVPWWEVTYSQGHYSVVVAPADLLGSGRALLREVRPDYGIVLPVLVGGFERRFGPLTLGGEVRLLLALQALYLALAAWLFARHARGRFVYALLAFLPVACWFHFDHKGLRFPNQTPWRTLGMALALAILVTCVGRSRRRTSFVLGLTSGAALLLNFESGVAVTVACIVWACVRFGLLGRGASGRDRWHSAGPFGLGLLASTAAMWLLVPVAIGQTLDLMRLPQLVANAAFTASAGFSGWPLTDDPWPVVMFGHAAFVLLFAGFRGGAPASPRAALRAGVAALLVVWFAYYANRPHPWNLSSYYLPYGLLLIDLLRWVELRVRQRRASLALIAAVALLALVVLPNLVFQAGKGARQVSAALRPALRGTTPTEGRLLSGVWLADPGAGELEERARFIRAKALSEGSAIYLTSDSYLVPKLSGAFSAIPVVDFCWQATTRRLYEGVLDAVFLSNRRAVYLDAPGTLAHASSNCAAFYDKVREDLGPRFERTGVESGWEVWRRRPEAP